MTDHFGSQLSALIHGRAPAPAPSPAPSPSPAPAQQQNRRTHRTPSSGSNSRGAGAAAQPPTSVVGCPFRYSCVNHPFVNKGDCTTGHSKRWDMGSWDKLTEAKKDLIIKLRQAVDDRKAARQAKRSATHAANTNAVDDSRSADHEEAAHVDMSHLYGQDDSSEPDTDSDNDTYHVDSHPYVSGPHLSEPALLRSGDTDRDSCALDSEDEHVSPLPL